MAEKEGEEREPPSGSRGPVFPESDTTVIEIEPMADRGARGGAAVPTARRPPGLPRGALPCLTPPDRRPCTVPRLPFLRLPLAPLFLSLSPRPASLFASHFFSGGRHWISQQATL
jgi:hypothetical protein